MLPALMAVSALWVRRAGLALVVAGLSAFAATALFRTGATGVSRDSGRQSNPETVTDPAPQIRSPQITATRTRVRGADTSLVGQLVDAARHAHLGAVEELIERGVTPTASDMNGDMPLHQAARAAAPEAVRRLLAAGANPNVADGLGWFPISYAVLAGSLACTELLLASGAVVQSQMPEGSPLDPLISGWLAAEVGIPDAPEKREDERVEIARALLDAGGISGSAVFLRKAITVMKNEDLVAVLLEYGVRLDTSTSTGSALMRLRGPIGDRLRESARRDSLSSGESVK